MGMDVPVLGTCRLNRILEKRKPTYNGKVVIVHGKNGVDFYKTNGKRGTRALFNAFNSLKGPVQNKVQMNFKDLGD